MLRLIVVLMTFSAQLALATPCDLQFPKLSVCAKLEFLHRPNRKTSSDFTLTFFDAKTQKTKRITQQVLPILWMKMKNGHEHGSEPVKVEFKQGKYLVSNVWFLMLGQWEIRVELKEGDKVVDRAVKMVDVQRSTDGSNKN